MSTTDTKPGTQTDEAPTKPLDTNLDRNNDEVRAQLDKAFDDLQQTAKTLAILHEEDADIAEAAAKGNEAKERLAELWDKKTITVRELAEATKLVSDAMQLTIALAIASRKYTDEKVSGLREETQTTFLVFSDRVDGEFVKVHRRIDDIVNTPRKVWVISAIVGAGGFLLYFFGIAPLMNHDADLGTHITSSIIAAIGFFALAYFVTPRGVQEQDEPKSVKLEQVTGTRTTQTALDATAGSHTPAVSKSADSPD